jgi:hypothetical protein
MKNPKYPLVFLVMNNDLLNMYRFVLFLLGSCNIHFPIENVDSLIGLGVVLLQPFIVFHSCVFGYDASSNGFIYAMSLSTIFLTFQGAAQLRPLPLVGGSVCRDLAILAQAVMLGLGCIIFGKLRVHLFDLRLPWDLWYHNFGCFCVHVIRKEAWPAPCLFGIAAHKALLPFCAVSTSQCSCHFL